MNRSHRPWLVGVNMVLLTIAPARAWANAPGPVPACPADRRVEDQQSGTAILCVANDRVYREGAFVVVDALLRNVSTTPIAHAEVEVAFYTDSGHLVAVEDDAFDFTISLLLLVPITHEFRVPGAVSFCLALLSGPETKGTECVPELVVA